MTITTTLPTFGLKGSDVEKVLGGGVNNAIVGLSEMAGQTITVAHIQLKKTPVTEIPALFGGREAIIIAVYLEICGSSTGHILVAYEPKVAYELIDLLLGQPPGSTSDLSEMERSALGEVGNVMGSFFLNHVAGATGNILQPSPPAVMMDMAGAILDGALASILAYSDFTYVVETVFGTRDRHVSGTFLVMPDPCGQGIVS